MGFCFAARLREEQEQLIQSSRELLSRDLLSELSVKSGRPLGSTKFLHGSQIDNKSAEEVPIRKSEGAIINTTVPFSREDEDKASILSEDSQDELSSELSEKKFVDLNSLSAGARKAAAPDIYNIFEQVRVFICFLDLELMRKFRLFIICASDFHGGCRFEYSRTAGRHQEGVHCPAVKKQVRDNSKRRKRALHSH